MGVVIPWDQSLMSSLTYDIEIFLERITEKLERLILKNILCTLCFRGERCQVNPVFCFNVLIVKWLFKAGFTCTFMHWLLVSFCQNLRKKALHIKRHSLVYQERGFLVVSLFGEGKWIYWRSVLLVRNRDRRKLPFRYFFQKPFPCGYFDTRHNEMIRAFVCLGHLSNFLMPVGVGKIVGLRFARGFGIQVDIMHQYDCDTIVYNQVNPSIFFLPYFYLYYFCKKYQF